MMNFQTIQRDRTIDMLVMAGAFFNAFLAFLNANIMGMSTAFVVLSEILIVCASAAVILPRFNKNMMPWVYFFLIYMVLFLIFSIGNGFANVKPVRDMLLVANFGLLGFCYRGNPLRLVTIMTYVIMIFALIEGFATDLFTSLFNAAAYYFQTRGIGDAEEVLGGEMSIFKNAMRYQGRFSFSIFDTHRLSSLFMEQTALANYTMFLGIVTSVFWNFLSRHQKILFAISIFLFLGFTDSRLALGFTGFLIIINFVLRLIPAYANLLYMPVLLIFAGALFYDPHILHMSDTLGGRIGWTLHLITEIDFTSLMGFGSGSAPYTADSGYGYLLYFQSLWGLIIFWFFTSIVIPQNNIFSKNYAHLLTLYVSISLLVGGSMFSIKQACLLWFFAGYLHQYALSLRTTSEAVDNKNALAS